MNKTLYHFRRLASEERDRLVDEYNAFDKANIPAYLRGSHLFLIGILDYCSTIRSFDELYEKEVNKDD